MGEAAIVLLSGGLDSTTTLAIARAKGYRIYALTFDYQQRHRFELEAARRVAEHYQVAEHVVANIDLRVFGGSALTEALSVPKGRALSEMSEGIPITYVPARNTIFLSFALAWAEVVGAEVIYLGVNALDYSGYPDCRPEYLKAFQEMANLATRTGVEGPQQLNIQAPLLHLKKSEIIQQGLELGVDYALTHSCYDPNEQGISCGQCDACLLRRKGFGELQIEDPIAYQLL